jgi:hypothetical protein
LPAQNTKKLGLVEKKKEEATVSLAETIRQLKLATKIGN